MRILQSLRAAGTARVCPAIFSLILAVAARGDTHDPQPMRIAPAPSSLVLLLAGLVVLVGWSWWRGRSRGSDASVRQD